MKDPNDTKTLPLPLPDAGLTKANEADSFSLDDDKPLVCNRDQTGDTTCESCQ